MSLGVDEVANGLGLGQVHLPRRDGAQGEFPGGGATRAGFEHQPNDSLQDEGVAVSADLDDVFPGVGMGRTVDRRDNTINMLSGRRSEGAVARPVILGLVR